ncbi:MAG: quinone-dependent dihydroorotate dehydrogenase, partial [Actinomycetota bacterium]
VGSLAAAAPVLARVPTPLRVRDPRLAHTVAGVPFPTPVGLAAGFDKNARASGAWPALGFGFVEVGTVTAHPQPGNPKPRIARLPADRGLLNRMGFNNDGADAVARRLERARRRGQLGRIPLGVNIGKSKVTDLDDAPADYLHSFELLRPYADYVVVNVSSPNTPGLRELQDRDRLADIVRALVESDRARAAGRGGAPLPLFVKLAPDLADTAVDDVTDLALELGIAGVVVSNTTIARDGLRSPATLTDQPGGVSGAPLRTRATDLVRRVAARAGGRLAVIGVGGVFTADDAWEKLAAGATLVQVYTGFVYQGPTLPRDINRGLLERMAREGAESITEVIGSATGPGTAPR